ncbi:MAG: type II toxin-antitoxin system Phd/YefM family antitoxin [Deltaproteobacteria bacterium]|nr:type II toxin-antitoxin system Phd/YefM family antitoxin [Deltaproteobacteria bacterium]MCB9478490.1 type II toxin-antitoxin system Phd/YefM family antitoxin [Deltaproteobacteria bacterium]
MLKKVTAMQARKNLGQIMNEVAIREDDYVVERAGKPMVAIISLEKYELMRKERLEVNRKEAFEAQKRIWEKMAEEDPDEMEALIAEAVEAVRKGQ